MFTEIIEIENALDKIKTYNLSENQINTLINVINENPTITAPKLLEITDDIMSGNKIILNAGEFSIDPILNESKIVNLMEIAFPIITKYIPKDIIGYLTETHARAIVNKILNVEFTPGKDTALDLRNRIDEMFALGDMSIPIQGLRKQPNTMEIVMHGVFAPMLYKGIQFDPEMYSKPKQSHCDNKNTLRNALKDYTLVGGEKETPLMQLLPKFIVVLKDLLTGAIK